MLRRLGFVLLVLAAVARPAPAAATEDDGPLTVVVMDPLAKELACACIQGYAQRDYSALAKAVGQKLGRPTQVEFSDDLAASLETHRSCRDLVVIGKFTVIEHDAGQARWKCRPLARLGGADGSFDLTGLFVVKAGDPAGSLKDLAGRRILLGRENAAEKHAAALAALRAAGVEPPATPETRETCSDAALDLMDSTEPVAPAAVISSYAMALLEGCGSIGKGDLKVIGKTAPVPFVTVFASDTMPAPQRRELLDCLLAVKSDAALLKALESRDGFTAWQDQTTNAAPANPGADWPDWRGAGRHARVPWLPAILPDKPVVVWKKACVDGSLAGLSVARGKLLVAERDPSNREDVVRCLDANSGELLWRVAFPAAGKLDYGESPRATPVVHGDSIYQLGAFGDLRCLSLADGKLLWQRQLAKDFGAKLPVWGTCATPLLVDGSLIVNPGAPDAALVALDPATGATRWTTPGEPAAYASFVVAEPHGHKQVIGYDESSLGAWDPATGRRLWRMLPEQEGDFNVPTPLLVDDKLVLATENNGTRMYGFDATGKILPEPLATAPDLAPDTTTPVATAGRIFGIHHGIHCLDSRRGLAQLWRFEDEAFDDHASLFASDDRVLIVTFGGELVLLDATANTCRILSRARVFDDEVESYSHPALAGTRLYLRAGTTLACVELAP